MVCLGCRRLVVPGRASGCPVSVAGPGGGWLVLTDQFSAWLVPTLIASRRKARIRRRATRLLTAAGFRTIRWHDIHAVIIRAATVRK